MGGVPREDVEGTNRLISDMDEAALPLGDDEKKIIREKTAEDLMEALIFEYKDGTEKASSDMDVEVLTL